MNFKTGDIVEVVLTPTINTIYPDWKGLVIVVTSHKANQSVHGNVVEASTPDHGYPVGTKIKWSVPSALALKQLQIIEQPKKKDKYLSPFSGRWE